MKAVLNWGTVLVYAGIIMVACRVTSDDDGGTATLSLAKFENGEISGWNANPEANPKAKNGIAAFNASDMLDMVNGGAPAYTAKGMLEGFEQNMIKGEQLYKSWVMDFGTEAHAKEMYDSKVQEFSNEDSTGSYPIAKAFVRSSDYGYDGYAIFGRYMVVLWLDGFGANLSEAKNKTIEFLQTIEMKLKELKLI
ncbi:MAG TPA: hypothetical protein VHO70_09500 [Chitinispirillaceae bacterium]|nr:hypothetical protein [Chitinispirillaceae bacterium]